MRDIENPITVTKKGPGNSDEQVTTHPSFAQIGCYRSQGGHRALYDSDFEHRAVMTIRINLSELHRNLSNDWHFGREEIVEIEMSEAQWATFISSPNMGSGVPCTLRQFNGEIIPGLPSPKDRTEQFGNEMKKAVGESLTELSELMAEIDAMGLPKGKAEKLKFRLRVAHSKLSSNLPFVADQFGEHMELTVERAKQEVHGYMTGVVQRAGITALGGPDAALPLAIEHREEES